MSSKKKKPGAETSRGAFIIINETETIEEIKTRLITAFHKQGFIIHPSTKESNADRLLWEVNERVALLMPLQAKKAN